MNTKNNCYLYENDTFRIHLYNEIDTVDMFGEDMLIDYGRRIPQELMNEYFSIELKFKEVQNKLRKYFDINDIK